MGKRYKSSVINSEILEFVAKTTYLSMQLKIKNTLNIYQINIIRENMVKSLLWSINYFIL